MQTGTEELQRFGNQLPGMIVLEGELSAATGDDSDSPQLKALVPVLKRLRCAFGMDMVFIGQLSNGRVGGGVSEDEGCNPFEEAYGREVLVARCGTSQFDAVAVFSQDGIEAGTLVCGVTAGVGYHPPPDSLKSVSRLLATTMRRMTACA